jgi:hypothetical protein
VSRVKNALVCGQRGAPDDLAGQSPFLSVGNSVDREESPSRSGRHVEQRLQRDPLELRKATIFGPCGLSQSRDGGVVEMGSDSSARHDWGLDP